MLGVSRGIAEKHCAVYHEKKLRQAVKPAELCCYNLVTVIKTHSCSLVYAKSINNMK